MPIEIAIKIGDSKQGLMGMSLEEIREDKPVIVKRATKKKKRKAAKDPLAAALASTIPKRSAYKTEVV